MDNITLITCSYNTPSILTTMLKSFVYFHPEFIPVKILVMENSSDDRTSKILKSHNIPFVRNPNYSHSEGVNLAFSLCRTKYALLVDSDIVFIRNCNDIFTRFQNGGFAATGKITGDRGGKSIYKRIDPWFCLIDMEQIQKHKIQFCDIEKTKKSFHESKIYDIGSTFFDALQKHHLPIGHIDVENKYFVHLEGMSWYKNKYDPSQPDTGIDFGGTHNHIEYCRIYDIKESNFRHLASQFEFVDLKDKFL